jgi:hypothetical protein
MIADGVPVDYPDQIPPACRSPSPVVPVVPVVVPGAATSSSTAAQQASGSRGAAQTHVKG